MSKQTEPVEVTPMSDTCKCGHNRVSHRAYDEACLAKDFSSGTFGNFCMCMKFEDADPQPPASPIAPAPQCGHDRDVPCPVCDGPKPEHVTVITPSDAQEVLANPSATPAEIEAAHRKTYTIPCAHGVATGETRQRLAQWLHLKMSAAQNLPY